MLKTAAGWELDVDRGPEWLLVKARRADAETSHPLLLADLLWQVLERHLTYRLVLELDPAEEMDDDLVDQLLELLERIHQHGGLMRVCGLSPHGRELLTQRHLGDRFVAYCDRDEAMLGHSQWPRQPR